MEHLRNEIFLELRNAAQSEILYPKKEFTMKDIPMRVVITKILPYFDLCVKKERIREFDLFGFRRTCVIDYGRIQSLSVKTPPKGFISRITSISPLLRNLEKLSLADIRSDSDNNIVGRNSELASLFSIPGGFPSLVHFSLNQDELHRTGEIDVSQFCSKNPNIWRKRIRSLSITSSPDERQNFFPIFFAIFLQEVDKFSEIVTLELRFLTLTRKQKKHKNLEGKGVVIRVPKVRRITLVNCSGFAIEPGKLIKYLCVSNMDDEITKYLYSQSPSVVELEIDGGGSDSCCSWLFDENNCYTHISELKSLRSLTIENLSWTSEDEDDSIIFDDFIKQERSGFSKQEVLNDYLSSELEVLEVREVENFPLDILTDIKKPLKLKEIVLNIESIHELPFSPRFPFSKLLTRMVLIEVYSITDSFFQTNEWDNLEILELYCDDFSYVSGGRWNKMPKMKNLRINNCKWMSDKFFEHMQFKCLESLSIGLCNGFEGKTGWDSFSGILKEINITNCRSITDELFHGSSGNQNCFREATHLSILGLPKVSGMGWSKNLACKLVKFEVMFCATFRDVFLVENDFENLRDIKIVDCGFVKGVNWGKMRQLRKVTARSHLIETLREKNEDVVKNETKLKPFYI